MVICLRIWGNDKHAQGIFITLNEGNLSKTSLLMKEIWGNLVAIIVTKELQIKCHN